MYSTKTKTAKVIAVWSDSNGLGATSTTAALIASALTACAGDGRQVLMMSTDSGPYDGVQILSPAIPSSQTMGNLLLMAMAGGLQSDTDFTSFVLNVGEGLYALQPNSDLARMGDEAVKAYRQIIDHASTLYDYIVIDVAGAQDAMSSMVLSKADIILVCVSQNMKHIKTLQQDRIFTSFPALRDKYCGVIITRYSPLPYLDEKKVCKMLSCNDAFILTEEVEIHKAACSCMLHDYISKMLRPTGQQKRFWQRNQEDNLTADELRQIVQALIPADITSKEVAPNA